MDLSDYVLQTHGCFPPGHRIANRSQCLLSIESDFLPAASHNAPSEITPDLHLELSSVVLAKGAHLRSEKHIQADRGESWRKAPWGLQAAFQVAIGAADHAKRREPGWGWALLPTRSNSRSAATSINAGLCVRRGVRPTFGQEKSFRLQQFRKGVPRRLLHSSRGRAPFMAKIIRGNQSGGRVGRGTIPVDKGERTESLGSFVTGSRDQLLFLGGGPVLR